MIDNKKCLICQRSNNTLYWHQNPETSEIWCYCKGKCQRAYSLRQYCALAGLTLSEFLKGEFSFEDSKPKELVAMTWPKWFENMSSEIAQPGRDYLQSRGLNLDGEWYYDAKLNGIALPYFMDGVFYGAQIRLIEPIIKDDGDVQKITTMPGTRLGLLWGNWDGQPFNNDVKAVVVCEGYFNAIALQQSFNIKYGGVTKCPWRFISTSGSGISQHHLKTLKSLKEEGLKIVSALDSDEAGLAGLAKLNTNEAITHYALTEDSELDWNEELRNRGHDKLPNYFLERIAKV